MTKACIQKLVSFVALTLLLGCNRGDKPQAWESNHARPMQETIASDMQDTQAPTAQMPAGHPPVNDTPSSSDSSSALPPGHPPVAPSADGVIKLDQKPGQVDVEDMHWTAPKGWSPKTASSRFVNAEFKLPKADGDTADGRLTVSTVGGNVEQNIERWKGQFGGKPEKQSTESFDVAGIKTTLVDLEGTFKEGGGPMMPAAAVDRPGYRMIGAIAQRGDTLIVVKATGPAKTMAARADEIKAFVKSLKIDK